MDFGLFKKIEGYMRDIMKDSAHDREHIYRVLYAAADIAGYEKGVDMDVLIAACLLHDIGRKAQFENPSLCHARIGSEMAASYLKSIGWSDEKAAHTRECINSHRYRGDNAPKTIEARILFDADKLDAAGALGIARTLIYEGQVEEPLYRVDMDGNVSDGAGDDRPSFLHEYHFKLKKIYALFYTDRGHALATSRRRAAEEFYENIVNEIKSVTETGKKELDKYIV